MARTCIGLVAMEQGLKLDNDSGGPKADVGEFRRLVGRLLYLQDTRPNILHTLSMCEANLLSAHVNHTWMQLPVFYDI